MLHKNNNYNTNIWEKENRNVLYNLQLKNGACSINFLTETSILTSIKSFVFITGEDLLILLLKLVCWSLFGLSISFTSRPNSSTAFNFRNLLGYDDL